MIVRRFGLRNELSTRSYKKTTNTKIETTITITNTLESNPAILAWYSGRGFDLPSYWPDKYNKKILSNTVIWSMILDNTAIWYMILNDTGIWYIILNDTAIQKW